MSRTSQFIVFAALVMILAACSTGRDKLVAGQQYEGYIQPGNSVEQVVLPDGPWQLIAWDYYTNEQELGGVMIQTRGSKVSGMVDFYVPYYTVGKCGTYEYIPPYEFCGRTDIVYVGKSYIGTSPHGNSRGNVKQDCWGVDHWPAVFHGKIPRHLLLLRDHIEYQGLELPTTMLPVRYRKGGGRGTKGSGSMSVNYYFNPELDGFAPSRELDWRSSEWHRDRAFRDPQRKAYIEKLVEWGTAWHAEVDRGLEILLKRGSS